MLTFVWWQIYLKKIRNFLSAEWRNHRSRINKYFYLKVYFMKKTILSLFFHKILNICWSLTLLRIQIELRDLPKFHAWLILAENDVSGNDKFCVKTFHYSSCENLPRQPKGFASLCIEQMHTFLLKFTSQNRLRYVCRIVDSHANCMPLYIQPILWMLSWLVQVKNIWFGNFFGESSDFYLFWWYQQSGTIL